MFSNNLDPIFKSSQLGKVYIWDCAASKCVAAGYFSSPPVLNHYHLGLFFCIFLLWSKIA